MFSFPSYTFVENEVIGTVEIVISGPLLEEAQIHVIGGEKRVIVLFVYITITVNKRLILN